ncbi:SH2 domain-containing protein 1B [Centropristis striata]|uniref:SH2 domain-containing protein 1B n=1 Tax=Centropristis striata TaxID=184440 RepID=UPI0027E0BF8A|nr:SH2 domain-containing protein 1B [Centropristis striata]XP_059183010.1 SH2 domain-containing protein 1B [Centropristis striata]
MAAAMPVFYHGAITKAQCEELLGKKNKDGAYLVRDSETIQGAMCLCVYKKKVVYTYRLLQTHSGHYTLMTAGGADEKFFKTLEDLILHYKKKNQGLAIHLRHSLKRKIAMLNRPHLHPEFQEAQRKQLPVPKEEEEEVEEKEEEPDYENAPNSPDYVEVLPDT